MADALAPPSVVQPRPGAGPRPLPAPIEDVWSRTGTGQRLRAVLLLVVNFVLFCGLCVFTHWLHRAELFDFSWRSYGDPLNFWAAQSPNLNDFVLNPINVAQTPIHALVLGLVVAAIVAVPILVSLLYRFPCAAPFCVAVFVFAHMPWMSVTLLGSCVLASVRPFRMNFRFGSALVGMLPVLAYLYLATRGGPDQFAQASPTERSLMAAPWILAILAACAMLAVVLLVSKLVNYRPQAVAPLVAVMFAAPVVLFHVGVGTDELAFRVLENQYGPRSPRFEPVQNAEPALLGMMQRLMSERELYERYRSEILEALGGQPGRIRRLAWQQLLLDFLGDRAAAYEACKRFLADHPASGYVPAVLHIQARVLDTRIDERRFVPSQPRRELYSDFPHSQSEPIWSELVAKHPNSPLAIEANFRLAQLELRRGELDSVLRRLDEIPTIPQHAAQPAATQPGMATLFARARPDPEHLGFEPRPFLVEARRLAELVRANRDDPRNGDQPLVDLARLDPHRRGYREQLLRLAEQYQDSPLHDNLLVRWADAAPTADERSQELLRLLLTLPEGDARPEALFRLADLEVQNPAAGDAERRLRGVARLREILTKYGESCWAAEAQERLRLIEPLTASATVQP